MPWHFLPPSLDLESATLSLGFPPRSVLRRSGPAKVATSDAAGSTQLRITLGRAVLQLDFQPHLVVDLPAPLLDVGLFGVDYDLRTGVITPRLHQLGKLGIPIGADQVLKEVKAWMRDLVTSTSMAIPPYDPTADADLVVCLQRFLANLEASGPGELARDVALTARLVVNETLAADVGPGGFRIPAGAKIRLDVELEGKATEVQVSPRLRRCVVVCSSLVLRQGGADQAELGRIVLRPGCALSVEDVRPLGAAGDAAALEWLVRLMGALATQGAVGLHQPERMEPGAVETFVKAQIEEALRPALLQWVNENAEATPGLDLRKVLGIAG